MKRKNLLALIEGAVMIALAMILSLITVIKMPFGGGITAASMIPIIIVSYRRKIKWGLIISFVYGVLQLLLGMENLQYATSFAAVCAIIFLDYIIAFAVLGLVALFRDKLQNQSSELMIGALISCFLRFVCHVISGCTVWAGVSIPTSEGLVYSLAYNAAYMIPETIITVAGVWYLSKMIDFREEKLGVRVAQKENRTVTILQSVATLSLLVGIVFSAIYAFGNMQNEDGFDITAIANADFTLMLGVFGGCVIIWAILQAVIHKIKSKA